MTAKTKKSRRPRGKGTVPIMRITRRSVKAPRDGLSDKELGRVTRIISRLVDAEFERAFGVPFPTLPDFISAEEKRNCGCKGIIHICRTLT